MLLVISAYYFISDRISPMHSGISFLTDTIYHNFDTIYVQKYPKPKPINTLTMEELWEYYLTNPCYLPLIADSALWEKGKNIGFEYDDLFNNELASDHPYRNRYLVGDFNVLNPDGTNRKIIEIYPKLSSLIEFEDIPEDIVNRMDTIRFGTVEYDSLLSDIKTKVPDNSAVLINFLEKVWKYRMLPINREYSINGSSLFAAGQAIVMCEVCGDTLIMAGRFATSSKRLDIGLKNDSEGNQVEYYFDHLPIGDSRRYYAGLNTISSKNWESLRPYEELDKQRDQETGGGHDRVVKYRDKAELSNFLTIKPAQDYPNAMPGNGIHEVALNYMSRGMLGTANSIGCLRVSDFGAKFLRWWVPQDCKLFIAYNDTLIHHEIKFDGNITDYLPFKNEQEGNEFRIWINTYYPEYAEVLEIATKGDYRNGYIIDGYYHLKDEYLRYKKNIDNEIIQ
jgi:hypothetical protein